MLAFLADLRPDAIVHTAAQPSHDLAAQMPFEDFDTNAVGTMNLLEATRRFAPTLQSGQKRALKYACFLKPHRLFKNNCNSPRAYGSSR